MYLLRLRDSRTGAIQDQRSRGGLPGADRRRMRGRSRRPRSAIRGAGAARSCGARNLGGDIYPAQGGD